MKSRGRIGGWTNGRINWEEGELENTRDSGSDKEGESEKQVCWVLVPRTTQSRKSLAHLISRLWAQVRPNPHSLIFGAHIIIIIIIIGENHMSKIDILTYYKDEAFG